LIILDKYIIIYYNTRQTVLKEDEMTTECLTMEASKGSREMVLALVKKYESALSIPLDAWQRREMAKKAKDDLTIAISNLPAESDVVRVVRATIRSFNKPI
jgi:hypothetical protein